MASRAEAGKFRTSRCTPNVTGIKAITKSFNLETIHKSMYLYRYVASAPESAIGARSASRNHAIHNRSLLSKVMESFTDEVDLIPNLGPP